MKILSYIGLAAGLLVLTALLAWQGVAEVAGILGASGWHLLLVPLIWMPTMLAATTGWRTLFPSNRAPGFGRTLWALWLGRAVNTLLPVASIGGEVVKARALILKGEDKTDVSASVVVDKTAQVITLIIWGTIGVFVLLRFAVDDGLAKATLGGLALLGAGVAGFLVVQRAGMFGFLVRSAGKVIKAEYFDGLADGADQVDAAVRALYARPGRIVLAVFWRTLAVALHTGETWLAAHLLGLPITLTEALMLKSLTSTLSDVAFIVPNSYGVQEGSYVLLGGLLGYPPDIMLAISLATRIREVIVDVPGLLAWQHAEGRAFLSRSRQAAE